MREMRERTDLPSDHRGRWRDTLSQTSIDRSDDSTRIRRLLYESNRCACLFPLVLSIDYSKLEITITHSIMALRASLQGMLVYGALLYCSVQVE
jgi:hypothetical protein